MILKLGLVKNILAIKLLKFLKNLDQYKIVYDKTFVQNGKYRSYIVIEYKLNT